MKQALLAVSFGTTVEGGKGHGSGWRGGGPVPRGPLALLARAYTSPTVRRILARRGAGPGLEEALEARAASREGAVCPSHPCASRRGR